MIPHKKFWPKCFNSIDPDAMRPFFGVNYIENVNEQNFQNSSFEYDDVETSTKLTDKIPEEVDHFFLLIMSIIIFFMQCGFAFMEAGAVR